MNKELIMKSDVLDIIFEKRNKAYGAYTLRKFYSNRLAKSLGLMLAAVVILSAFTFLPKKKIEEDRSMYVTRPVSILHEPEKKKEVEKPKAAQNSKPQQMVQHFNMPIIVDIKTPVEAIKPINDSAIFAKGPDILGKGPIIVQPVDPGPGTIVTPEPVKPAFDKTQAIFSPEFMPEFPGGMDALHRFLERNLTNPKDLEDGNPVSVKVQFVVGFDGKLQRFQIIEDGGEAFNKEVIRVLKKMPDWKPGKSSGQNVSVYCTIPVKFVVSE